MKQKLLQDVGSIITSNRSNCGRWIRQKKNTVAGVSGKGLTYEQYLDMKNINNTVSEIENN